MRSLLEFQRDRVVIQDWDLSCGAAALATLLKYQHGEAITEREVAKGLISRTEYIENPDLVRIRQGFSLLDLKRFSESRGFVGTGLGRLDLDALLHKAPAIVPISVNGYNHFVVFRGMAKTRVLLADPAFGKVTMPADRFLDAWIDFGNIGRVAFIVDRPGAPRHANALAPDLLDFVLLR